MPLPIELLLAELDLGTGTSSDLHLHRTQLEDPRLLDYYTASSLLLGAGAEFA